MWQRARGIHILNSHNKQEEMAPENMRPGAKQQTKQTELVFKTLAGPHTLKQENNSGDKVTSHVNTAHFTSPALCLI